MILRILKKIAIGFAALLGVIIIFLVFAIAPLNDYDYKDRDFYQSMLKEFDTLHAIPIAIRDSGFSVGYATVSITPSYKTSLAGYGSRKAKLFTGIHDSVFVRTLVIENGNERVAIVSGDLLIIPPIVTQILEKELPSIGFTINNTYMGATHTHNSIGNWQEGAAAFLYGSYSDSIAHFIANQIKQSIQLASQNIAPATIRYGNFPLGSTVRNRLVEDGGLDSLVHVVEVERKDKKKLVMVSYTAHSTCISQDDLSLSRDYPGVLVDSLEKAGYDFAMYMAGAVGSHTVRAPEHGWSCTEWIPEKIMERFKSNTTPFETIGDSTVGMLRVPLFLPDPQVKISRDWKIRPWLFRSAVGEFPVHLTALRIGDLVLLGAPCDYSGEMTATLYSQAAGSGYHVMVTSFNGGYIGYITPDQYYDIDHTETRVMNWYGPGSGSYMSEAMSKLLDVATR